MIIQSSPHRRVAGQDAEPQSVGPLEVGWISLLPAPSALSRSQSPERWIQAQRNGTANWISAAGPEPVAPGMLSGAAGWVARRAAPGSARRRRRRDRAGGRRPRLVSLSAPGSGG